MKRSLFALAGGLALLTACETTKRVAWESGLPGIPGEFRVVSVERRAAGEWLDVRLESGGVQPEGKARGRIQRRILTREDGDCARMLVEGQAVTWSRTEPYGHLSQGELRCSIAGLGDLEKWRDARSRRAISSGPIRTQQTRFHVIRQDEQYTYAQGGFSLIGHLGWTPGTDQVVALLPRGEQCDAARANAIVTMEFRVEGRPAFALVTPKGLCPIEAVVAAPRAQPEAEPAS
jgi:hypothetical protein